MDIEQLQKEINELRSSLESISGSIKNHTHDGINSTYLIELMRTNQNYEISGIKTLSAGGGSNCFKFNSQSSTGLTNGLWLGGETFAVAPFSVDLKGNIKTSSITITGGSFTIGTDAFHIDSSGNLWWGSSTSYASATYKIGSDGTITGKVFQTAATGLRLKIYTSGSDGIIELLNGTDSCGTINVYWEDGGAGNDIVGYDLNGGGGAYVAGAGRDNLGWSEFGEYIDSNNYAAATVSWIGGSFATVNLSLSKTVGGVTADLPISSQLIPSADGTLDIGLTGTRWRAVYADEMYCTTQTAGNHITGDLSFKSKGEIVWRMDENPDFLNFYNKKNKLVMKLSKEGDLLISGKVKQL